MTAAQSDRRAIITEALRKIDDLTERLHVAEKGDTEPIAVIGMACRLPGGVNNPDDYWKLLQDGTSGVIRVPADRWDADAFYSEDYTVPGTICNREGGFLTSWQPDEFDAEFFGISPREASGMDPQHRLLLEVAWEALENAGITAEAIRGTQTGTFLGLTTNDYLLSLAGGLRPEDIDPYIPFGNASNFAAGRLAYFLGVNGPALVFDTACSSSLVAIHVACQSLRRRETDTALAAGVNLILSPENNIACSRWGMLAPDGRCKAFDASANGYVRSEGCGVVVLKRLGDAQRDGDQVLAVVRGSAVNQDGASSGQTVPNGLAQQALIRTALAGSRLQPSDIDYIEAHGTGTSLGDPIELDALAAVFGDRDGMPPLVVGSVKTNLGHLESAAGVAGFIKAVMSVRRGVIPRQLHFERLNERACEGASRFTIASEQLDWPQVDRLRRAGVSSFGVSGTNAHVVVEQAPATEPAAAQPVPVISTLVVPGRTPQRIASLAGALADWFEGPGASVPVHDVAHTVNHHRTRYSTFATVTARDTAQAVVGLRALAEGYQAPGVLAPHDAPCRPGTVFVYSGQGSQWAGMGRRLLAEEPAFAAAVAELEPEFLEQVGFSLRQVLESGEPLTGIDRIQPVLVGLQLTLTALWRAHGVHPDAVIGHSMGEVAAAVVAGALTPADGLKVIATRSRLLARLSGQGAMALLELDAAAADELIAGFPDVTVAVYASPRQTVIAGPPEQIDAAVAVVAARDLLARRVEVDVASHHPIIDPVLPELRELLADLHPRTPTVPLITTAVDAGTASFDADYWAANLRNPVRFGDAVAAAGAEHGVFVEVSPHPVLTHAIDDTLATVHHHSIGTLSRDTDDSFTFRSNLNATFTTRPPNVAHPPEPHAVIPNTPWHHGRHWITLPVSPEDGQRKSGAGTGSRPATGTTAFHDWFHELAWPARELPTRPVADGSWLVVADTDFGGELLPLLGADSRLLAATDLEAGLDETAERCAGAGYVLYAPPVDPAPLDPASAYRLFNAARRLAAALSGLAVPPRLMILTRNAQPVAEGDRANPAHAILWGLGRTLALEYPEIWHGVVDVDDLVPPQLVARYVRAERDASDREDQVVYRAGVRRVPRLRPGVAPATVTTLEGDTSHVVIGATGNIGPDLIRQLAEMGAGTIVAVSRRGGAALTELADTLAQRGTRLVDVAADVADETAMAALFKRFGNDLPPLDGVWLAALAGRETLLSGMTDEDVTGMFRPKVDAVSVLHRLTLTTPVRRFVLFSSVTGVIGSRWLGHYTAAGAYLDAFAYARRALGLPATVVDWGLWKSWADAQPATAAAGLVPMPNEVAIRAVSSVIGPDAGVRQVVVAADWSRLAEAYRMRGALRIVDDLLPDTADPATLDDIAGPRPGTLLGPAVSPAAAPTRMWRSRLLPGAAPYPGSHRIRGTEVVPASILLETVTAAVAEAGASGVRDVRFEYPVVLDSARVVHESDGDDGSVAVSSSHEADAPAHRWIRHVSARIGDDSEIGATAMDFDDPSPAAGLEVPAYDESAAAELQRSWGIEGRPYPWTVGAHRGTPGRLCAEVHMPEPSVPALVDAAIHIARLADSSNPGLMFPASVERVRLLARFGGPRGIVDVRRRGGDGDWFSVDVDVKTADGTLCVELRGLRYTAVDSDAIADREPGHAAPGPVDAPAGDRLDWSHLSEAETLAELQVRLQAILARELGTPPAAVRVDQPFPELGLDSMMAMTVLREAKKLTGVDLSATMLWNHPTVAGLAEFVTELLAPQRQSQEAEVPPQPEPAGGLLDELFDSVESVPAHSESGV